MSKNSLRFSMGIGGRRARTQRWTDAFTQVNVQGLLVLLLVRDDFRGRFESPQAEVRGRARFTTYH